MLSLEGKTLGNYDVIRRIRVGGMGAVYEGRQRTAFGRRVAIKVILGDYASDRDMRRRFAREARTIAGLHHPHILPLIEFGDEQGILYLVMPFIDGGTLTSYLRHHLLDLGEVSSLFQQLLDAVEYAHDHKLIHRDIKSSNVLLEMRRNAAPYVYLADFGLVRTMRQSDPSQVGKPIPLEQVPGTPHYMAPEQTMGIVTPLTDIYALGVLLYQMLTGNLPYNDPDEVRVIEMHLYDPIPSPCDYDASIPAELGEVVQIAMSKHAENRYQSIAEMREAFLAAMNDSAIPTTASPAVDDLPPIESVDADPVMLEMLPAPEIKRPSPPTVKLRPPSGSGQAVQKHMTKALKPRRTTELPESVVDNVAAADASTIVQKRATPTLKRPPEAPPRPIIMHNRPRVTSDRPLERPEERVNEVAIRERRERADRHNRYDLEERMLRSDKAERERAYVTTENFRRPRNTDEPLSTSHRSQRGRIPIFTILTSIIVVVLLVLLLGPRLLGWEIFPASVPLVGSSPDATVRITARQKTLQNTFVLLAEPQVHAPDLKSHTLPDRVIQSTLSDSSTVATTGKNQSKGTNATGIIEFQNPNPQPVQIAKGTVLNAHSGLQVQLTQDVTVPAKQGKQLGDATASATVMEAGQTGNIVVNDVSGTCCTPTLFAHNPAAFTGGSDPTTTQFVTQSDIDGAQSALTAKLEQELTRQLQQQIGSGESMVGTPQFHVNATTDPSVNTQSANVKVEVKVSASAILYKKDVAIQTAMVLLNSQAINQLGSSYHLQGKQSVTSFTAQSSTNNTVYLNVSVSGIWTYSFTDAQIKQLRDPIRGATRDVALTYLQSQTGVGSVDIHLPFGTDHLPDNINNIDILLEPQP
jgi:serine/threonine protein kinase